MTEIKSPFLVHRNILPVKMCDELTDVCMQSVSDRFSETIKNKQLNWNISNVLIPEISSHYNTKIIKTTTTINSFGNGYSPKHGVDGYKFNDGTWYRIKDIDFVTIIFLKNHLEHVDEPLDESFEVYGGKLEFPTFNFGFLPERGTAITYPAVPNFLNTIAQIKMGQLDILQINYQSAIMFSYNKTDYPGNVTSWFSTLN